MAYRTITGPGQAEHVVKKSRFLARVVPAGTEQEAWSFIERVRRDHPQAAHHCFAFKTGQVQRMSDDGEPSGTAGRPIFDVLDKQGLSDTVIVVARYFGGVLLGAGGLVRAYSQAAVAGVESAGVIEGLPATDIRLLVDYPLVGKVQHLLKQSGARTLQTDFQLEVTILCRVYTSAVTALESDLAAISAGRILVARGDEVMVGADLLPIHDTENR